MVAARASRATSESTTNPQHSSLQRGEVHRLSRSLPPLRSKEGEQSGETSLPPNPTYDTTTHAQPAGGNYLLRRTRLGVVIVATLYLMSASWQSAMTVAAEQSAPIQRPSKEQTKRQLADILAQDKYRDAEAPPLKPWSPVAAILRGIAKAVAELFAVRDRLYEAYPMMYWTIVVLLVAIMIGIVLHMYLAAARAFGGSRARRPDMTMPLPAQRSSSEMRALAQQAAESGDFAQAVVYLYLAILINLDERGWVVFSAADTNRQLLDQIHAHATLAADLRPLTDTVDAISYSSRPATADDWSSLSHLRYR